MTLLLEPLEPKVQPPTTTPQKLPTLRFGHLGCLLTEIGLWQHAEGCRPHQRHGYSIDDEARGLIVGLRYWEQAVEPAFFGRLGQTCFRFIEDAAILTGRGTGHYHNFCDAKGRWLDSVGSDDSFGRTFWGLGVAHAVDAPFAPRDTAEKRCSAGPYRPLMTLIPGICARRHSSSSASPLRVSTTRA